MGKNKSLPAIFIVCLAFLVSGFAAVVFSATYQASLQETAVSTGTVDAAGSPSMMTAEQKFSRREDGRPRCFVRQSVGSFMQKVFPCYRDSCVPKGIIVVIGLIFVGLACIPFYFGIKELYRPQDALTPFINAEYAKDARYFDRSFWDKLNKALGGDFTPGTREVMLSKKETVEVARSYSVKAGETRSYVIYASGSLHAENNTVFRKEIYATDTVQIGAGGTVRAIAAGKDITLADGVRVIRWIGTEGNLKIGERCLLGARTLCEGTMTIGKGCAFRYLFGAPIKVYADPAFAGRKGMAPAEKNIEEASWRMADNRLSIPPFTAVEKDMVVEGNVSVKRGCTIKGCIKAYGNIVLGDGVTVDGDLFSENVIDIGERCVIRGNVFAQGEVFINGGVSIGTAGAVKTVFGKKEVQLFHDSIVYGHVITEGMGIII